MKIYKIKIKNIIMKKLLAESLYEFRAQRLLEEEQEEQEKQVEELEQLDEGLFNKEEKTKLKELIGKEVSVEDIKANDTAFKFLVNKFTAKNDDTGKIKAKVMATPEAFPQLMNKMLPLYGQAIEKGLSLFVVYDPNKKVLIPRISSLGGPGFNQA